MQRIMLAVFPAVLLASAACAADVRVLFDPGRPDVGPFPTDYLTVPDKAQKTGIRINLPYPFWTANGVTGQEYAKLNQLDGFSLYPRLRISFSGAINPDTLRAGVHLVWLDRLVNDEYGLYSAGTATPINEVLYDAQTNTAFAKPDEVLAQTRRYALIITDQVKDQSAASVQADPVFTACIGGQIPVPYCGTLGTVVKQYEAQFTPARVIGASIFTTLSATAWMENANRVLHTTDVGLALASPKPVFDVGSLQSLTLHLQAQSNPTGFVDTPLPLTALAGVGRIAFGSYRSPLFLDQTLTIPTLPTGSEVVLPAVSQDIQFELFLPASPKPAGGYPVVIVGHPMPNNRFGLPFAMAATLASRGFATMAINMFGSGLGPDGQVVLTESNGTVSRISFGGRAVDVNHDGLYDPFQEGCWTAVALSDCARQNALDHLQLVRAIQKGIDVTGTGVSELDATRIYYVGVSLGAITGSMLNSLEPAVRAAVINGAPGPGSFHFTKALRPVLAGVLKMLHPELLNNGDSYDTDYVLRYQPAKTITVPGAVEVQEYFERLEWMGGAGQPIAWAPHFWWTTLAGQPMKRTLFQIALGDTGVPAPSQSVVVRAANLSQMTSVYRHDLAIAAVPDLANYEAHYFLMPVGSSAQVAIALTAQRQVAEFFASDTWSVPDVNGQVRALFGRDLFETPPIPPETLGW